MQQRAVRVPEADGRFRAGHRLRLPTSDHLVVVVPERETLGAALGHARDALARPTDPRHVRVSGLRRDGAACRRSRRRRRHRRRRPVTAAAAARPRDVVQQRHAVQAILRAGER